MKSSIEQRLSIFGIVLLCSMLLFTTACQPDSSENHSLIPVEDMEWMWTGKPFPDDILPPPEGDPTYRANIPSERENFLWLSWQPIEETEIILGNGSNEAHITYRDYMETIAPETSNNIIKVIMPKKDVRSLRLYVDEIPEEMIGEIVLTDGLQWSDSNVRGSVLAIGLLPGAKPGKYTLDIGFVINDKDYGTAPCTIEVVEDSDSRTIIPFKRIEPPLPGEEKADDFVFNPAGGTYRANSNEVGVENLWEPIEVVSKVMGSGDNAIEVQYRDYIETKAGETRKNIIYVSKVEGAFMGSDRSLGIFSLDIPSGIELTQGDGPAPMANMGTILVIDISSDIVPGEYKLEIFLVADHIDYGTIMCTVEVVE